jgi:pyruvate dehydrogenase E1 component alpha subunit
VIENNGYAMGTSNARHAAGELYRRGEGYGIPGEQVDGMDVFAVQAAARQALDYVRSVNGPYILEVMTYRYRGHSMSDPGKYRSKEEVEKYRNERDPIEQLKKLLEVEGVSEEALKPLEKEVKEIVNESAQFAQESPEPDPSELWTDILVEVKD